MPNKHNADCRHHIPKMKFKVANWPAYEAGFRRRGSLILWVTEDVMEAWNAVPRSTPGGQQVYSDSAIEANLMLRGAFHLPLRQTEGLMGSVFELMGVDLPVQTAKVRELRGGIPTMTADGYHILRPAPAVSGFFFASGCNVAGLSISPTVGEALATWIVDGKPPMDLSPMALKSFQDKTWSEEQLIREAAWQYRHFYGAA